MTVLWTPQAEQDRADIWDYIAADNPGAAIRMDGLFSNAAGRLSENPRIGRAGTIPGTRELVIQDRYMLVYEIDGGAIWILALVYTARQWPPVRD